MTHDGHLSAGDINADFLRNSNHTNIVRENIEEVDLVKSWDRFHVDFTHCHEQLGASFVSTVDHFFWSESLSEQVVDAGVIHHPDNKSDHSPVYCVLEFRADQLSSPSAPIKQKPKPSWKKSNSEQKENYKIELENKLQSLVIPPSIISCRNVGCKDPVHREELDHFTIELLETVQSAAEDNLVLPGNGPKKPVPGWRESVAPFRQEAYFWHQVWVSQGRPLNNDLHNTMKKSRNKYHYEYKKCRKSEDKIRRNKLLDYCVNGGGDIFTEIKSLRKTKQKIATSMDGVKDDIKDHFRGIYEKLYNSANDSEELGKVQQEAETKVTAASLHDVEKVTPEIVKEAAHKLKSGKSDPSFSFSSDCIKNGTGPLYDALSAIIQSFLIHGHVTVLLLLATLVPIIKDKLSSPNSSKNYRSIAISSILLKLIDWVFILLYGARFGLNDFQFAYQAGCSTTMCTWAALETIDFFMKNGSEVYTCAMDMTKAFDLTLHSLLFKKMLAAGFPAIYIRLFIFIYANQMANVRWNGEFSTAFTMTNGCRQGAVLSAIAYCFYCENLFTLLKQRRAGCWVLGYYHGILGYSDDNWLLAPSLNALQDMLVTCEQYAASHNLKFSTDPNPAKCKTKLMAFLKKPRDLPSLYLCGNPLPWVSQLKHLGNTITNKIDGNQQDIKIKSATFINKNNSLNQEFYFAHPATKIQVNRIHNSHFTGSQIWKFGSCELLKFESVYNKSIKIIYDLPWETHRFFLEPLSGFPHISRILVRRYMSFIESVRNSKKLALRQLFMAIKDDTRLTTGWNLRYMMTKTGTNRIDDLNHKNVDFDYHLVKKDDEWKIGVVKELIDVKQGELGVEGFNPTEISEILQFVCTS